LRLGSRTARNSVSLQLWEIERISLSTSIRRMCLIYVRGIKLKWNPRRERFSEYHVKMVSEEKKSKKCFSPGCTEQTT
jgi:hypothetical protein